MVFPLLKMIPSSETIVENPSSRGSKQITIYKLYNINFTVTTEEFNLTKTSLQNTFLQNIFLFIINNASLHSSTIPLIYINTFICNYQLDGNLNT